MTSGDAEGVPRGHRADGPATMPSDSEGWWERERATFIRAQIAGFVQPNDRVLDVGCGRGRMLDDDRITAGTVVKVDSYCWPEWKGQPGLHVCATANALPFREDAFDVVASFDVLEHLEDDRAALAEQCRVVRPGGIVAAAVPADPRLWSRHDEAVGHERRYRSNDIVDLAASIGLGELRVTSFFSYLWIPAYLSRRSRLRTSQLERGDSIPRLAVGSVVGVIARLERRVLRRIRLPIGTSLWFKARVPERNGR